MPFVCVQTAPRSGKPADRPRKADSQGAAGRKLQAAYSPASGTSVHLEGVLSLSTWGLGGTERVHGGRPWPAQM